MLPFKTVDDYLEAGPQASPVMRRQVLNFGRRSADELHDLVIAEAASAQRRATAPPELPPPPDPREQFRSERLNTVRDGTTISVRLGKILDDPYFGERNLAEALFNFPTLLREMRRTPNCGRKSTNELALLCARHVARTLSDNSPPLAAQRDQLVADLLAEHPTGYLAPADLAGPGVPAHENLSDRIDWLLSELPERQADILKRRYGLSGADEETLEEIGQDYNVTRERIRQLQAGGLRKLRTRISRAPIDALLADAAASQWRRLAGDDRWITFKALPDRRKAVEGHVLLAVELAGLKLSDWLDQIGGRLTYGWCEDRADADAIRAAGAALEAALKGLDLPRLATDVDSDLDARLVEPACALILEVRTHLGYIASDRIGPRIKRAIGLHATLGGHPRGLGEDALLEAYHRRFPTDLCSVRDAEIVMFAAPHMFLQIVDGVWAAVGAAGAPPFPQAELPIRPVYPEEPGTIAQSLEAALLERGLSRIGDLYRDAEDILPEGRSANSVGPVLLTRSDLFKRALPGVYGLAHDIPEIDADLPHDMPALLNPEQARLFAMGRYAGEPRSSYPLWSVRAEEHLCRWARHAAEPALFQALLAVAEPGRWAGQHDLEDWIALKQKQARFAIGYALQKDRAYERPDLDQVLAGCLWVKAEGGVSWMGANRILGHRVDSYKGAGLLAVLSLIGVITPPRLSGFAWQSRHEVGPNLEAVMEPLIEVLTRDGRLRWERPEGEILVAAMDFNAFEDDWIDRDAVRQMMSVSEPVIDDFDDDPLAEVIRQRRRDAAAQAHDATLNWLLDT